MYLLTNGIHFLAYDSKSKLFQSPCKLSEDSILKFKERNKADNFLLNLPKYLQNRGYYVIDAECDTTAPDYVDDTYFDVNCCDDIIADVEKIQTLMRKLSRYKIYASQQHSLVEKEIMDIEHASEFYNLSPLKGYKLYQMLHNARKQRRKYKDNLQIIDYIMSADFTDYVNGNPVDKIKALEIRQYEPRVLTELFD